MIPRSTVIPAGTKGDRSIRTSLASTPVAFQGTRHLYHRTAGLQPAGSGNTMVGEAWGCILEHHSGTTYGQWYATRADAEARYNDLASEGR